MAVTPRYIEPGSARRRPPQRRVPRRLTLAALALAAVGALFVVWVMGQRGDREAKRVVERFATAWERSDYQAMYDQLDPGSRGRVSRRAFASAYARAATTATAARVVAGEPEKDGDAWRLPVRVRTRIFGLVRRDVLVAVGGDPPRIAWSVDMTFPGVRKGRPLRRVTRAPRRAALQARDGRLLARSDGSRTDVGAAVGITGELGQAGPDRRAELLAAGFPLAARVGVSGIQRALDERLRGTPGGTLFAGREVLARTRPRPAPPVRSSVDPDVSRAAQDALAGRFGSVAAIHPLTGEVLGLAGIALDGAQPPGSTMKIITVSAALEDGKVKMTDSFPVLTGANAGGRYISNAHGEACGGNLVETFAKSCNSVYGPMGAKVGGRRLVAMAERFGFNKRTGVPDATPGSIPRELTSVETGASAIGQDRVLATSLNMAVVAGTIANRGRRPLLTLLAGARPRSVPATTPRVAAQVTRLMEAVVHGADSTGGAAKIDGVRVAGKTGTAELGGDQPDDAWFVAFAPAQRPRISVGVLVVHGGAGGDTAAPIARQVLQAGL
jgi:transpeptidase family protein